MQETLAPNRSAAELHMGKACAPHKFPGEAALWGIAGGR